MKYKHMWEMQRKDEQIADLQRALSDAHVYLYDERQQVLALSAENDELKIQELEDRKRIQHLLALTQPVSQEVTYFKDRRPHTMTRNYPSTKNQLFGTASSRTDPDSNMGASARRGKASQGIGLAREVEARYRAEGQGQEKKWGGNGYGAANDDDRHDGNTTDAGRRKEERTGRCVLRIAYCVLDIVHVLCWVLGIVW